MSQAFIDLSSSWRLSSSAGSLPAINWISTELAMLKAQQQRMGAAEFWPVKPVLLPSDAGAVQVRRKLKALVEAETSAATPA